MHLCSEIIALLVTAINRRKQVRRQSLLISNLLFTQGKEVTLT